VSRVLKGTFIGALAGGALASIDGAFLGAFLSLDSPTTGPLQGALAWAGYCALGGAGLGGFLGAAIGLLAPRMTLKPPDEKGDD
jgi:hypothetical protein